LIIDSRPGCPPYLARQGKSETTKPTTSKARVTEVEGNKEVVAALREFEENLVVRIDDSTEETITLVETAFTRIDEPRGIPQTTTLARQVNSETNRTFMRDLYKSIDYIERGMLRRLDRKPAPLSKGMVSKPQIRAWRAPVIASEIKPVYPEQVFRPKDKPKDTSRDTSMTRLTLSARALKVTIPLDAAQVAALPDPGGQVRCQLAIACEGKVYTADIATKSLRKAKATIAANGVENVFAMVQGKLRNNEIVECGLVAQVKTPPKSQVEGSKEAVAQAKTPKPAEVAQALMPLRA
jgi:hypothetical protein